MKSVGYPASPVRWGIIGCGDVCRTKSGPAFAKVEFSELVAVCRRTPGAAEEWARLNNVAKWCDDAKIMLNDTEIDAVYIATPPDSHLSLGLAVAAAGKACLCEKPLGRNSAEAAALAAAFERVGKPLYTAYYRRALPHYTEAKELLPKVGRIKEVHASVRRNKPDGGWRTERTTAGGGHTIDIGSHVVDILDFLLGPILVQNSVSGRKMTCSDSIMKIEPTKGPHQVENYADFTFTAVLHEQMKGRCVFDFDYHGELEDFIRIVGENGTLQFAALGLYGASKTIVLTQSNSSTEIIPSKPMHVHLPLIEQIVTDLRLGQNKCSATGAAGVRAAIAIDAALERASERPRLGMASYSAELDIDYHISL